MKHLSTFLSELEKGLTDIQWPKQPESLYQPMEYVLSLGGKRIRPLMALLGASMYSDNPLEAMPQALGIEIFHNFTLVHDDMMDAAPIRRGKPTVHKKWGNNIGLLAGDGMLVMAYKYMCQCPADKLPAILEIFNKAALEVCEGQQFDMDFGERKTISLKEYIEMIRLKTAVLLGTSLQIGATVAGASKQHAHHLYLFGEQLGLAFQIQDDWLDLYGNPEKFGKQIGGDILENKKTWLWVKALESATTTDREKLLAILEQNGNAKIEAVKRLYDNMGISAAATKEIQRRFDEALQHLDLAKVSELQAKPLYDLAESLMKRQH